MKKADYLIERLENSNVKSVRCILKDGKWSVPTTESRSHGGSMSRMYSDGIWQNRVASKYDFVDTFEPPCIIHSLMNTVSSIPEIACAEVFYSENSVHKAISSCSSSTEFHKKFYGVYVAVLFSDARKNPDFKDSYHFVSDTSEGLSHKLKAFRSLITSSFFFFKASAPVKAGNYEVVLSPAATGLFIHETVGHKSESDYYCTTSDIKQAFSSTYSRCLSVCDDGSIKGPGFTPFDDEATPCKKTYIIKNGIFKSPLFDKKTLLLVNSPRTYSPTGNARSVDFYRPPIVRMTSTYVESGDVDVDSLFNSIEYGIYVSNVEGGFGTDGFSLYPHKCYEINGGKIARPVRVNMLHGNVDTTLSRISSIANDFEMHGFAKGGCGKNDQWPLPVGFGGPHIKIDSLGVL